MSISDERTRRILTTHVGSLPRPEGLSEMMAEGKIGPAYEKAVRDAVTDVVRRQVECGIDIVDDGEQSKLGFITYIHERLGGMKARTDNPAQLDTREKRAFPEFYKDGHSGSRPAPMLCTGPVRYVGQKQLQRDLENLKAGLDGVGVTDVFVPAVSPGQIFRYPLNRHYKTNDEFLIAVGDAMREEYQAIFGAGSTRQTTHPHLA